MKKNLKEFNPRDHSWASIQKKKSFDSQLSQHLKSLPDWEPDGMSWNGIQDKMKRKKRIAFFRPLLIAAGITAVLTFFYFLLNINLELKPEVISSEQFISKLDQSPESEIDSTNQNINRSKKVEDEVSVATFTDREKASVNRKTEKPIVLSKEWIAQVPRISTRPMDLNIRGQIISSIEVGNESFHQVTISWGMNEKRKFRIGQPKENPLQTQDQLIGIETEAKKNQLLNFKIK